MKGFEREGEGRAGETKVIREKEKKSTVTYENIIAIVNVFSSVSVSCV